MRCFFFSTVLLCFVSTCATPLGFCMYVCGGLSCLVGAGALLQNKPNIGVRGSPERDMLLLGAGGRGEGLARPRAAAAVAAAATCGFGQFLPQHPARIDESWMD